MIFGRKKRKEEEARRLQALEEERRKQEEEDEKRRAREYRTKRILEMREKGSLDNIVEWAHAYWSVRESGQKEPKIWPLPKGHYEPYRFLEGKANENILVAGSSRQGKSYLTKNLLRKFKERKRIVFSFKPYDEYLFLGPEYPVVDAAQIAPDPFSDVEAFVCAFAVTYPITTVGVVASYVPVLLREMVKQSKDWKGLGEHLERESEGSEDTIRRSALGFIREHIKPLAQYVSTPSNKALLGRTVILDFSNLNEDAKTFYAELLLRSIWNKLKTEKGTIVVVDEAHRLTRGRFEKYESIVNEMGREVGAFGALWVTTQNYTDVDDKIRGNFATQLLFKTTCEADLQALERIDPLLSWVVSSLDLHDFTDAQCQRVHDHIPMLYYQNGIPTPEEEEREKEV